MRANYGYVLVGLICDYGKQYVVRRHRLWKGAPKSCGHDRHLDLQGHRLVKLTEDQVRLIRKLVAENPGCRRQAKLASLIEEAERQLDEPQCGSVSRQAAAVGPGVGRPGGTQESGRDRLDRRAGPERCPTARPPLVPA